MKLHVGALVAILFAVGASCVDEKIQASTLTTRNVQHPRSRHGVPSTEVAPKPPNEVDAQSLETYDERSKTGSESVDPLQALLVSAVMRRNTTEVEKLLKDGKVNPGFEGQGGETPLFRAIMNNDEVIVKLLLATGRAKPNHRDGSGWVPLTYATVMGYEGVVRLLLEAPEIKPNLKDKSKWSSLFFAAAAGYDSIVETLLNTARVEVDLEDIQKRTPLWWSVQNRHFKAAMLLMETKKANPNHADNEGVSPLSLARKRGDEAMVELLQGSAKKGLSKGNKTGSGKLNDNQKKRPLKGSENYF